MATRDPSSPQGKYQREKRAEYIKIANMSPDCVDLVFWNACDSVERVLGSFLSRPGPIKVTEVFDHFTTPYPKGLCKTGQKLHPKQSVGEYTLITQASVWTDTEHTQYRWSRGPKPALTYPKTPEIVVTRKPVA
jgi:hypothetical protein